MSAQNQISIVIPATVIADVTQKLQDCKTALAPYLQGLTATERMEMFKMGDKTVATVQKTKQYLISNPEFAPSYMDQAEFLKDEAVVTQLAPIVNLAKQLFTDADDTVMLAGGEALLAAMLYYGTVKEAFSKGVPTAKPIYEDLKARFAKRTKKTTTAPTV
jgi:hypothetical protein